MHSKQLHLKYFLKQVKDNGISRSEKEGIRNSGKIRDAGLILLGENRSVMADAYGRFIELHLLT